jgi:acyl carrier protein
MTTREMVRNHLIETLQSMGDEWEDQPEITEETLMLGNMNWRSIEIIYLTNALQQHYQRSFPFEEFLQKVQAREISDTSVGEWVDFLTSELNKGTEAP